MVYSPIISSILSGIVTYLVMYGIIEQEFRRHKQYKRWKVKRISERISAAAGLFLSVALLAHNFL